jgi:phage replication-related protein YjqB (UPF0714/DUF867 family)
VRKATNGMPELLNNQELCRVDPALAAECGVGIGDQIRLERDPDNYAIYTISGFHDAGLDIDDVRMGLFGRHKLGTPDPLTDVSLYVGGDILRSDLSDAQAQSQNELVERLTDDGLHTGLIALAAHGGAIEPWTDQQAEHIERQLASKRISCWRCKGWSTKGAFDRWHIEATSISRNSFPLLDSIGDRGFSYSVSLHGMSSKGVLIGGLGPEQLKQDLQAAIIATIADPSIDVSIAGPNDAKNGNDPANLVNWLTSNGAGGIQIEQSMVARSLYWQQIAEAIASVFDPLI